MEHLKRGLDEGAATESQVQRLQCGRRTRQLQPQQRRVMHFDTLRQYNFMKVVAFTLVL